jgi:predicted amidohydrolase
MKIGYMQFAPALADVDQTMRKIDDLMTECKGVDLLVLPELCNSGYNFESPEMALKSSEPVGDSVFIRYLESKCAELNLHIVSGLNEREGGHLFNSAILVGPRGYIGRYRKLHLFMKEKSYFRPGDAGLPVFDIGPCKVGLLVCFDWIFPEVWRVLALKGADLICHPSNLVLPGFAQKAVPVHALTNHVFVITCNRVGSERELRFTGLSTIADPKGEVLLQATQEAEELRATDVEILKARDKKITPLNDIFQDRRPTEYALLSK